MLLLSTTVVASDVTPGKKLVTLLDEISTFKAYFVQKTYIKGNADKTSKGKMYSKRPNLFRWEVHSPFENLIIADGKNLLDFDKDLEQIIKQSYNANDVTNTPFFLSGNTDVLLESYNVKIITEQQADRENRVSFKLTPKGGDLSFEYLIFSFVDNKMMKLTLHDQLGQTTVISFIKPEVNTELSSKLFKLEIPKGIDVVIGNFN